MLADTVFLIDLMENEPSAVKRATEIEGEGLTLYVGSPTIFELYVGLSLSKSAEKERTKIMRILASLPQLPLDFESASSGGLIYGDKVKAGSKIDPEDAMLAGIAKAHKETILTRNIRHFEAIEGITIERY